MILTLSFEDLGFHLGFRVLGFVVLESKENLNHARYLSMSKDMRDWLRANLGFAAQSFHRGEKKRSHSRQLAKKKSTHQFDLVF